MISEFFDKNKNFLAGLPARFKDALLALGHETEAERGKFVFSEGSEGTHFCVLLSGTVRLYKTAADGREVTVRLINEGEMFGEVILFENETYPVSAAAVKPSRIFMIPRTAFIAALDSTEFRNDFITVIMRKQRYLAERILHLAAYDVEERFFRFLEESYGRRDSYLIDLSKQDIAAVIGTLPETLSRLLARLKKRGVISWQGKRLIIEEKFWEKES